MVFNVAYSHVELIIISLRGIHRMQFCVIRGDFKCASRIVPWLQS